ncbi:hypothetical protein [Dictyobacter kobayashii]|uniref:Uncharacterized protein n=1 Tax=Dictyobacter kobayashii TaxID=2014872 RepID=A0A402AY06_9CHLR|nr:hypothetical protein [Dictyobacter kobayashii]GCE24021.1 hypothetical protein KDK_78210 [Dictyobacter kobayashii]
MLETDTNSTITPGYTINRYAAVGRSIGMLWLLFAGTVFPFGFVFFGHITVLTWILGGIALCVFVLLMLLSFGHLRLARKVPMAEKTPENLSYARRLQRWFIGAIIFEIVGIILSVTILPMFHHAELELPVILLFIGIHEIPIARVFGVPAYLFMGVIWCLIIIAILIFVPSSTQINGYAAWDFLPTLICMLAAWITVAYLNVEGRRLMRNASAQPAL